jgi:uncharacterized membrane protein YoaK (UPF0700 family)
MPSLKPHGQMSEAFITALFLSVSGGLQDVYTYLYRGKVFANAQTGNIVLMAVKLFAGEWGEALRYLMPLCAFALGIFVAEFIRLKLKRMQWLHWRQLVVLFEILMLFVVGFLPQELNLLANSLVSFSCAMQVQSFRKVNGYAFASTMCIGNLRSGMDSLCAWLVGGSTKAFGKAMDKLPDTWRVYVLSSHPDFERCYGRFADKKRKLYNGMLKCDLFMYGKRL